MSTLYLRSAGRMEGPFDPAEVRRRLSAGEVSRWTMSWRVGEKRWQSLGRRWPEGQVWDALLAVGGTVLVLVLVIAIIGIPGRLYMHLPDAWQTKAFVLSAVAVGITGAAAVSLLLARRNRQRNRRLSLPGALCVMLTVMGAMISMGLCVQIVGLIGAENQFANASFGYDAATHAIRIQGPIGHRFESDLDDALSKHRDAQAIVIDSPGGLLDQAFNAATAIKQAKLPLRVERECASACALMWAAVPLRQMIDSARIGLHQNRAVGDSPSELSNAATKEMEDESNDALSSAGFTGEMMRQRAETPPAKMYWLNAVDIMTAGIDAKVLDVAGQPVDEATAKWVVLSSSWGKDSLTERFYQIIAVHEPALADTYEDRLYNALHSKNWPLFRYEDREMETAALRQAFTQVSDQAVMDWTRSRQQDIADANRRGNKLACDLLDGHAGNEVVGAESRKWVAERSLVRNITLVAAMPAAPQTMDAPMDMRKAVDDYETYVRSALARVKQEGYPASSAAWSGMQHCNYANEFLQGLEQMPVASGAEIVRYSESGRRAH